MPFPRGAQVAVTVTRRRRWAVSPRAVTSRLRVAWPERGKLTVRLTTWVRVGPGGTWAKKRRASGPERSPAPSTAEGNAKGWAEAAGPGRPGPIGRKVVPRKPVAIP